MRTTIVATSFPLALVLASSLAMAQEPAPPPPQLPPPPPPPALVVPDEGVERDGFVIGFALGGGNMVSDCDNCDAYEGAAFELHVGTMVAPSLALLFDLSSVTHPLEGGGSLSQVAGTGALQVWVLPRAWLRAGLGWGNLTETNDEGEMTMMSDRTGSAFLLGAGVELFQSRSFAIDAQARLVAVDYVDVSMTNFSAFLGFNWY